MTPSCGLGCFDPRRAVLDRSSSSSSGAGYSNPGGGGGGGGGSRRRGSQMWDWPMKLLAVIALLEWLVLRPIILPGGGGGGDDEEMGGSADFIGFVLCHCILGFLGNMSVQDLSGRYLRAALINGFVGGAAGYAWLLFYVQRRDRRLHHLFVANVLVLAGVLCGAWTQRQKKAGTLGRTGVGRRL